LKKCEQAQYVEWGKLYGPKRNDLSKLIREYFQTEAPEYTWFIDNGTLLASYRENGRMIPHDDDFDIGVYIQEFTPERVATLARQIQAWLPEHFKVRTIKMDEQNPDYDYADKIEVYDPSFGKKLLRKVDYYHVTVDIQFYSDSGDNTFVRAHHVTETHCKIPVASIVPVRTNCIYENETYNVSTTPLWCPSFKLTNFKKQLNKQRMILGQGPNNPKVYLEAKYGYLGKDAKFNPATKFYEKR